MKLPPLPRNCTLRLTRPVGRTALLAALFALILVGAAEIVVHQPGVQQRLPVPSVGSTRNDFEIKVYLADGILDGDGRIDCLFLGSSVVWRGVNPRPFEAAYQAAGGETLRCFNFALAEITLSDAPIMTEFLIRRYAPRLLVYGLSPRDFSANVDSGRPTDPAHIAWMRYQRGEPDVNGWLIDHLLSYRYYLAIHDWMAPDFQGRLDQRRRTEAELTALDGHTPSEEVFDLNGDDPWWRARKVFKDYHTAPGALAGVRDLVALADRYPATTLVLAEIPLHPAIYTDFLPAADYDALIAAIESSAGAQSVLFVRSAALALPPEGVWKDSIHLNGRGAALFSAWLGEQTARALGAPHAAAWPQD